MKGKINCTPKQVEYLPCLGGKSKKPRPQLTDAPMPYNPLVYGGGPLLVDAELVSFYWGNFSQAEIDGMQAYLRGLAGYLSGVGAPEGQVPVIWQYNCGCAHLGASFAQSNPPASATDADVHDQVIQLQTNGELPPFSSNRLFLIFTKGITFDGYGTVWCAYHSDWGPGQFYALCPQPVVNIPCGSGDAGWQSSTSHEIMEAMTDPVPFTGWTEMGEEGGDVCAWQDVSLSFGTVQKFADNNQRDCTVWTPAHFFSVTPFSPWQGYAIPNGLWLPGDYNRDRRTDIVHAVENTDYVNVWRSNGDSTFHVNSFSPWNGYAIPNGLWLTGDYNGDRQTDIVHAVQNTDYVNVWKSNGDGTFNINSFSPWSGYGIPNGLWLVGDYNGDARADIVHAVENTDYVNVWLSNGDGTFNVTSFSPWSGYGIPNGLWLVGDFTGDGRSDIVHAVENTDYVNVWRSNGDGTFNVNSFSPWNGYAIPNGLWLVGDFDGDGKADIVHAVENTDYVNVWRSNGDGTFHVTSFSPWPGYAIPNGIWLVGDFNGDGKSEIVHAVENTDYVNIWISNGDGTFTVSPFSPWPGYAIPNGLWMVGDYDGDGKTDIVHAVENTDYVNVWLSRQINFRCG